MTKPIRNILFITWDGPETTYLESLFLPILAGLKVAGYNAHVLQFSWGGTVPRDRRAALCAAAGIPYRSVTVLRRGGAAGPFLTAWRGAHHIRHAVQDWRIDTLMPRSLMPALAVLSLRRSVRQALHLVFDADGLAVDERVDFSGLSPHGLTYRLLRDVEAEMLRQADVVLCRTEAAKAILHARAGAGTNPEAFHVVTNGVDPQPFAAALSACPISSSRGFALCYCGSIGQQYRLPEMISIALRLKGHVADLRFRIFALAQDRVAEELARHGLGGEDWITCQGLSPAEVPHALVQCDLGIALRQPQFSTRAVLPIKISEYLMAGLPVIGTPGVGDTAALEAAGVFRSAEAANLDRTIRWVLDEVIPQRDLFRQRCHEIARTRLSHQSTIGDYLRALASVGQGQDAPCAD